VNRLSIGARVALLSLVCMLPVACSSGGQSELVISEQNAQQVAMQGVGAVDLLGELAGLAQGLAGSIGTEAQQVPCDSGNVMVNIVDAVPQNVLSTGDSVTVTYNGCVIGGLTLNGTVSVSATEITGTEPGPFSYSITANFQGLTAVIGGAMFSINGGFTVDASTEDAETYLLAVHGDYFSAYAGAGGQAFSGTLRNFRLELSENQTSGVYVMSLDAEVSGSELGGTVTYETTTPFSGTGEGDPGTGEMKVTGAEGGSVTLIALNETNVQLLLDLDGDTVTDVTINTTWAVLSSGA